jgi:F1F0 ATPase subunit 2
MSYPLQFFLVFTGGVLAGWFYFSGLMLTVARARAMARPEPLFLASFAIRAGLVLLLFLALSRGQWDRYGALILGFLAARTAAIILWGPGHGPRREVKAWRS